MRLVSKNKQSGTTTRVCLYTVLIYYFAINVHAVSHLFFFLVHIEQKKVIVLPSVAPALCKCYILAEETENVVKN